MPKILLFSYAFPPMQVQMSPAVYKPMAALSRLGYEIDVVCSDSFCSVLALDHCLMPYLDSNFASITRLAPASSLFRWSKQKSRYFANVPDLMADLHDSAFAHLMDLDLSAYDAVMTWSPFHSINPVMVKVKKARPNTRWMAQFCDPWDGNPLETHLFTKLWNRRHESQTVRFADRITHSSAYSLQLMMSNAGKQALGKTKVLPHVFDSNLYPQRPKAKNDKIVIRHLGALYGRRSPDPVFAALLRLFERRKELTDRIVLELVGTIELGMLQSTLAKSLPPGVVRVLGNVSYLQSLELMYDADALLLIEANVRQNLFLASKVSDYLGADTPIVGLVPPGASEDAMMALGSAFARPDDIEAIANRLEDVIDFSVVKAGIPWCNEDARDAYSSEHVALQFRQLIQSMHNE